MTELDRALNRAPAGALESTAERVSADLDAQQDTWCRSRWTRRRFLAGAGMVGVAALGSQLVTTRAAYAAAPTGAERTLVVIFLRGAADGLHVVVPASAERGSDFLATVRRPLVPASSSLLDLGSGWGLNGHLKPLYDQLWASGELAFVPAVSTPGVSRSHFQAQQFLERGGSDTIPSGWLDRLLAALGPGTTFRAVAQGSATPVSLSGTEASLTLRSMDAFKFPGWDQIRGASATAVGQLYRGVGGPLGEDVPTTLAALATADRIRTTAKTSVAYPNGTFANALKTVSSILRSEVGLQVATIDVGGWDTHTDEARELGHLLDSAAAALTAFFADLGAERRKRVTVAVMTEFGRRVAVNGNAGADHGHGSLMWLLGGGLAGSGVYGKWSQLSAGVLDQGDVPAWNNPFDVLGELAQKRLGVGSLSTVFPGHALAPLGVATTS
jgi:uncharacterized protein (DUF1501 family)